MSGKEMDLVNLIFGQPDFGDLERFYECINHLADGTKLIKFGQENMNVPEIDKGVYFFLDEKEKSIIKNFPRIVRIGTHAIRPPYERKLKDRLREHWGKKDGGGEHRASIFRGYVGASIINNNKKKGYQKKYPEWGIGTSAKRKIKDKEEALEIEVSKYIRNLYILALDIDKWEDRKFLETNTISFLSSGIVFEENPVSKNWLGNKCLFKNKKLDYQLWNITDCDEIFENKEKYFKKLEFYVERTIHNLYKKRSKTG
jgi:hypothetical protein